MFWFRPTPLHGGGNGREARAASAPVRRKEGHLSRPRLRILTGVDFSPESRQALDAARGLARSANGTITIAHVRPLSDVKAAVVEERGDLLRRADGSLEDALADHFSRRLAGWTGSRAGERTLLLRGAPGSALCREARRGYDLLVLGSRGRGRVAAALLGSTVQEALSRAPIPVLVIRRPAPRPRARGRGRSR